MTHQINISFISCLSLFLALNLSLHKHSSPELRIDPLISGIQKGGDSDLHLVDFTRLNLNDTVKYPWFMLEYNVYNPDPLKVDSIKKIKKHLSFIVFGSPWSELTK